MKYFQILHSEKKKVTPYQLDQNQQYNQIKTAQKVVKKNLKI